MKIQKEKNSIGLDGSITLIFSNLLIILSLGSSLLWYLLKVISTAKSSSTNINNFVFKFILVPGVKLKNNGINEDFNLRLNRAKKLFYQNNKQQKIVILGGITGSNTMCEAQAGANYLLHKGVSINSIILENYSKHTLDNLNNARKIISTTASIIISNRYHLFRVHNLASGLKLNIYPIAAEENFIISIDFIFKCLKEAYFMHWYFAGKLWLKLIKNKASEARIS